MRCCSRPLVPLARGTRGPINCIKLVRKRASLLLPSRERRRSKAPVLQSVGQAPSHPARRAVQVPHGAGKLCHWELFTVRFARPVFVQHGLGQHMVFVGTGCQSLRRDHPFWTYNHCGPGPILLRAREAARGRRRRCQRAGRSRAGLRFWLQRRSAL